jgi:hypothetical protein
VRSSLRFARAAARIALLFSVVASPAAANASCFGYGCKGLEFFKKGDCLGIIVNSWSPVQINLILSDEVIKLASKDLGAAAVQSRRLDSNPSEIEQCNAAMKTPASRLYTVATACGRLMKFTVVGAPPSQSFGPIPHGDNCVKPAEVKKMEANIPPDFGLCIGDACFTLKMKPGSCRVENGGQRPASIRMYETDLRETRGSQKVLPGGSVDLADSFGVCRFSPGALFEARFK